MAARAVLYYILQQKKEEQFVPAGFTFSAQLLLKEAQTLHPTELVVLDWNLQYI